MPRLRWFAQAREVAGTGSEEGHGATVAEVLADAVMRHGPALAKIIECSAVWVDGEPAQPSDLVGPSAEVAVLPPVSGGSGPGRWAGLPLRHMALPDPLAADLLDDLGSLTIEEVRERRTTCQARESELSYVRRLAQGRLDIVLHEIGSRRDGVVDEDVIEALTHALADRITAPGHGHLPTTFAPNEVDPALLEGLDAIASPALLSDPKAMTDSELRSAAEALETYERDVSVMRRAMFDRIDALQAEVVRRYQTGEASVDNLLAGP